MPSIDTTSYQHEVPESHHRIRADKVISFFHPEWSRSKIQKLFTLGYVWIDDTPIRKSQKLQAGDLIEFQVPPVKPCNIEPQNIPINVLFEDEDVIVINKAPGMVVHPGAGTGPDTLVHALLYHCKGQLSGIGGEERPGIVHRLDKQTSGVIIAAKSDKAFIALSQAFAERQTQKRYLALIRSIPPIDSGYIDLPIGRHPYNRLKMTIREDGRQALSHWKKIKSGNGIAFLQVQIHTGRTHQIRVHLASKKWPILGDPTYGGPTQIFGKPISRVMLHAHTLTLKHPLSEEEMTFKAPLPDDFRPYLDAMSVDA